MSDLASRRCVPLPDGSPPVLGDALAALLAELGGTWEVIDKDTPRLRRTYKFTDFASALAFVDRVGRMADDQDHHPEITLSYGRATIDIWTHTVGGLSENDFIFAARCDALARN